jgi:hypothetical protein
MCEGFFSWTELAFGMAANHCHSCEGDGMIVLWVQYTHDLPNIWRQNPLHPTYV